VLRRLRIENLVLIREAELDLAPGLNAITGETGAGKTILAQAVGLLLGTKGDEALVGSAGEEAYVEAELGLPEELDELAELKPEDEDSLLVARRVSSSGRTRAYAWGRAAAREDVAAAVERVIAMSGQFEQRRLARPAYQLEVLDRFCGDEQRVLVLGPEIRQLLELGRQVELRLDVGLRPGRPDERVAALRPEQEPDGLREDRLARPGLAGDRGEPRRRLEVSLADQHEVLDAEATKQRSGGNG
jgi:DNA repair ATPase RecN